MERPPQRPEERELTAPPAPGPIRIRALTFNAFIAPGISSEIDGRLEVLGDRIAALDPQLVALQEVWHDDHAARIAADLAESGLVHHHWVGRSGTPPLGSSGLLTASVYPIERVGFVPYEVGAVPPIAIHADWMAGKGVLMVRVVTPLGPIDFANTHLHSSYLMHDHLTVRTGQSVELVEALATMWGDDSAEAPAIVAGDFNSTPQSLPIRLLESRGRFTAASPDYDIDAVFLRAGTSLRLSPLSSRPVLTDGVALEDDETIPLSDHPGVLVELELSHQSAESAVASDASDVSEEAARYLEAQMDFGNRAQSWLWALAFLSAIASWRGLRRVRRSYRRKWRWRIFSLVAIVATSWSVYLAASYWPRLERDLEHVSGILTSRAG